MFGLGRRQQAQPLPPPLPGVDSAPTQDRCSVDSASIQDRRDDIDSAPAQDRRSVDPASTIQPAPLQVRPLDEHVDLLVAWVTRHFPAGAIIESIDMREHYDRLCEEAGIVPRHWNLLARELKDRMGRGARGGRKTYGMLQRADGTYERRRIYIVPETPAARTKLAEPAANDQRVAA